MNKKIVFILIAICVLASIAFLSLQIYNKTSFDGQFKEILRDNGWGEVLKGGKDNSIGGKSSILYNVAKSMYKNKLVEASIKSGYDPSEYIGKSYNIDEYRYSLRKSGGESPLEAVFCVYKGKIVCAYISHSEIGVIIDYWPLSEKYTQIIKDIEANRTYSP